MIEQADIGKAYLERVESVLLSDTDDAKARERLFAQQIRAQLPLEALELSLKQENGFTAQGARYMAAIVQSTPEGRKINGTTVVIRHLGLLRQTGASPDIVANMFIIESSDLEDGPHILYRPFYSPSLLEFSTRAALLDAIAQPGHYKTVY